MYKTLCLPILLAVGGEQNLLLTLFTAWLRR